MWRAVLPYKAKDILASPLADRQRSLIFIIEGRHASPAARASRSDDLIDLVAIHHVLHLGDWYLIFFLKLAPRTLGGRMSYLQ